MSIFHFIYSNRGGFFRKENRRIEITPLVSFGVTIDTMNFKPVGEDNRRIKYAFEWEQERNEGYRSINLVQPAYISGVLDEARGLFR